MHDSYASFEALNKKRRILVVEDEIINQEILRYMLEEEYDTLFAAGGEQALGKDAVNRVEDALLADGGDPDELEEENDHGKDGHQDVEGYLC